MKLDTIVKIIIGIACFALIPLPVILGFWFPKNPIFGLWFLLGSFGMMFGMVVLYDYATRDVRSKN